tara:strand:+ start:75 stop:563 length:489 start_codon:yes stop_codon:yes gene_type:complete
MNRFTILILLLSIGTNLIAQNQEIKKSELKKIFRKSIKQDSRRNISTLSNPWVINNTDSLFFKADTIKLINFKTQYKYDFCEKINWSFYKKDKFYQVESQTCREPSSAKVSNENSRFWITITKNDFGLILNTYNLNGLIDRFLVLLINQNEIKDEIVLKRIT